MQFQKHLDENEFSIMGTGAVPQKLNEFTSDDFLP